MIRAELHAVSPEDGEPTGEVIADVVVDEGPPPRFEIRSRGVVVFSAPLDLLALQLARMEPRLSRFVAIEDPPGGRASRAATGSASIIDPPPREVPRNLEQLPRDLAELCSFAEWWGGAVMTEDAAAAVVRQWRRDTG
jgi:hypothetical protein